MTLIDRCDRIMRYPCWSSADRSFSYSSSSFSPSFYASANGAGILRVSDQLLRFRSPLFWSFIARQEAWHISRVEGIAAWKN